MAYTWESQACQYPKKNRPGIHYFPGDTPWGTVDCLLYYGVNRRLWGVLNYYSKDFPLEQKGNVNIIVDPARRRRGVARALVSEARQRWGPFNVDQQDVTPEGEALVRSLQEDTTPASD